MYRPWLQQSLKSLSDKCLGHVRVSIPGLSFYLRDIEIFLVFLILSNYGLYLYILNILLWDSGSCLNRIGNVDCFVLF